MSESQPASKKQHAKSRGGCVRCKQRHVKCDERHPTCAGCTRLALPCEWRRVNSRPQAAASILAPRSSPGVHDGSAPSSLQTAELSLLHYWTLTTASTLSEQSLRYIWQSRLVELGFRHGFLLHAMLAVAAVHKAIVLGTDVQTLYQQSLRHMECTLVSYRIHLGDTDVDRCSAMFATACLITMHSLAIARLQPPANPIAAMCEWMRLIQGVRNTMQHNWDQIPGLEIAPLVFAAQRRREFDTSLPELTRLEDFVTSSERLDGAERQACIGAVRPLHTLALNLEDHSDYHARFMTGIILSWPAELSASFLDLVLARKPEALIIVAYYAGVLQKHDNSWFVRGWPESIIKAVENAIHRDLHRWLQWPTTCLEFGLAGALHPR